MKTPFDGRFKILAEEHPDLLLRLLGVLQAEPKIPPVHLLRELQLDPVQVDHLYLIGDEESGRVVHFEAITHWETRRIPKLALYRLLLKHKYKVPVSSYVVLMSQRSAPKNLPERLIYEDEDLVVSVRYRVIRLWEIDPSIAFEPGCEVLLSWVPLLRGGLPEFVEAVGAVKNLLENRDENSLALDIVFKILSNLATLATLRYDKETIRHLLAGLLRKSMLSIDLFTDSWLYKDGKAEGKAEGMVEGEVKATRANLQKILHNRFPDLGSLPEIDQIDDAKMLNGLVDTALSASTTDEVRAAIQSASRVN